MRTICISTWVEEKGGGWRPRASWRKNLKTAEPQTPIGEWGLGKAWPTVLADSDEEEALVTES